MRMLPPSLSCRDVSQFDIFLGRNYLLLLMDEVYDCVKWTPWKPGQAAALGDCSTDNNSEDISVVFK